MDESRLEAVKFRVANFAIETLAKLFPPTLERIIKHMETLREKYNDRFVLLWETEARGLSMFYARALENYLDAHGLVELEVEDFNVAIAQLKKRNKTS
ncbi:MAG: hypothetical protein ACOZAO_04340 [Patescibacteria group bacterium]